MPIYAYKCESCGHAKDVLQKISDEPLTICPACGEPGFRKQLTAAGFQLKGSGWYVTDFREGSKAPAAPATNEGASSAAAEAPAKDSGAAATAPAPAPAATPAAKAPASPPSGASPT